MAILIVGASGATGTLLLQQLLDRGQHLRAIVRTPDRLPDALRQQPKLEIIQANVTNLSDQELQRIVSDCTAVASCLGHNMTFRGIFGHPRALVTDTTRRLCDAIRANNPHTPVRFVLMNSAGNTNRDLAEPVSLAQRCIITLLRHFLPPHADNENAADHLRQNIGQNDPAIHWAAVRPDALINLDHTTPYELHPSPTRSAIFNPGKTSRINVAHFMADLLTLDTPWAQWRGQMPIIYNKETP